MTTTTPTPYGAEIPVTVPGGHTFVCRRPDLDDAMFRGLVPLPLVKGMFAELMGVAAAGEDRMQLAVEALFNAGGAPHTAEMVDAWVCLAAKAPRVVTHEADAVAGALWIGDLPLVAKLAIFGATFTMGEAARLTAARTFHTEPAGAPAGSSGAPVSGAPLVDVEHR